ncbi:peptide chain release factor 2 [bacterium Unc6]|nr:peptide chain release factor 2 [bacterium Unc6]
MFDLESKQARILSIEEQILKQDFWKDSQAATKIIQELKILKTQVQPWDEVQKQASDILEFSEIVEKNETSEIEQIRKELQSISEKIKKIETISLFTAEHDHSNAFLTIHSGAGGTESCDWVSMLLRMYKRWAENKQYKSQILDYLTGESAGIKSATILITGEYAYGNLRSENGVHRLVRISPFDSNKRRHTSFASVDVIPQIEDDVPVEIKEADLKIDVYRASGPGGQGVNTTDSAVRITHIPTNIIVQCQNERSQLKNKASAMKVLKARIYEIERKKKEEKMIKLHGVKQKIEWGSQIRSYILQPYTLVKDHRTDIEVGNTQSVLDGDIDIFIEGYLKKIVDRR